MKKWLKTPRTFASTGHKSFFFRSEEEQERAFIQWNVHEETENGFGGARIVSSQLREGRCHRCEASLTPRR